MNAGLLTLANWLIHAGDEKERNREYDRRMSAQQSKEEDMMVQRDALNRLADQRRRAEGLEDDKTKAALKLEMDNKSAEALKQQNTIDLLKVKQAVGMNVPFNELDVDTQAAALRLNGDPMKALKFTEDLRAGMTVSEAKAAVAKNQADAVKAKNDQVAAEAIAPTIARDAIASTNAKYLENRGGGVPLSNQFKDPNLYVVNPDASVGVKPNPLYVGKEDGDASVAALLGGKGGALGSSSLGSIVTAQTDGIYKNPAMTGLDPQGNITTPTKKIWEKAPTGDDSKFMVRPTIGGGTAMLTDNRSPVTAPIKSVIPKGYEQYADILKAQAEENAIKEEVARKSLTLQEFINANRARPFTESAWRQ